jgi:POT family proton-dependent oligopeptide transporter
VTGALSTQALAAQIFGLYVGLVYFTPVFGGLVGDRVLGRRNAVALGALLMTAGHFCMAFDQSFLLALLLLILGAGCLRGNLLSQVGQLYLPEDRRRADGFQIYYSMVNTGAFIAPLITGALGKSYGWHVGFGFAGFGMLAGLIIYVIGHRHVPVDAPRKVTMAATRLTPEERRVVLVLILLLPALTMFWIAQSQIWNVYNLWARDHVDLTIAGWSMPVPWLQSIDGIGAVALVPPVLFLWRGLARRGREPDDIAKLGVGCLLFGASVAWLACGQLVAPTGGRVPLAWAVGFHFLSAIGYLHVQPVAIGLFARTAPKAVNAMMIGVYFLSIFVGSTISGRLGGLYEQLSPLNFWLLHAAIVTAGGSLILLAARPLRRELAPRHPDARLAVIGRETPAA